MTVERLVSGMDTSKKTFAPEEKTEAFSLYQASFILLGMLTQVDSETKFFAILIAACSLLTIGVIQRTYMKKLALKYKNTEEEKEISNEPQSK